MSEPSQGWAPRLVAKWCDNRAARTEAKLIKRCRSAYRAGPLVEPVNRFADLLEEQVKRNTAEWRRLATLMRAQADEAATAGVAPSVLT
jgi:hypothetical protein